MFGIFSRLDKGMEPADHHTIFFMPADQFSEGKPVMNHVSFEMLNIDDVFMGHEILQQKKESLGVVSVTLNHNQATEKSNFCGIGH